MSWRGPRRTMSRVPSGRKAICWSLVLLAFDVHAVDHLADVVLEADGVLSPSGRAGRRSTRRGPSPGAFGEFDGVAADGLGLSSVGGDLGVVALLVDAVDALLGGRWVWERP